VSNSHAHETASRPRSPFEGVTNVVRFNWPLYASGFSVAAATLFLSTQTNWPTPARFALLAISVGALYLLTASLLVSHLIYDRSPLYHFNWAAQHAAPPAHRILNLHSGFDESSPALKNLFPTANLLIFDFYDKQRMTEASIARARRYQNQTAPPWLKSQTQSIAATSLPLADNSIDTLFAILALHEVRQPQDRTRLFAEITRVLRPAGRLLLVEHLRNPANFLAFGPQFVHFYSRRLWLNLAQHANLNLIHESRITPFVALFVFEKPAATTQAN
jgi:ubiquinone/menaquinone biosynthesis C-methylase UbiE